MKLAQHSFPIRVLIRAREEPVRQLDEAKQNRDVETDRLFQIRTLHFHRDFFTGRESSTIDLSQRSGGDRLAVDLRIAFVDWTAEFCFNSRERLVRRKCGNLILKS